ncbi:HAD-IIIC family phosphatase [Mangrovicella endophytica]|uniref:HAD-IIIC family phosphatase n=1 Tax=Mangrovicella endophytica TaxID=2066697 RepID=UPI000C9DB8F7|nr:HAD-IIIC family phosphatase [Mangrovicella endophytica]
MKRPAWWRFLPEDGGAIRPEDIAAAAEAGPGVLSRLLRQARAQLGANRASSLLRRALPDMTLAPLRPVRLLFVSTYQATAVSDALTLAFAIAGLRLQVTALEGIAAAEGWIGEVGTLGQNVDLVVLSTLPEPDPGAPARRSAALRQLASRLAHSVQAPAVVLSFGDKAESADRVDDTDVREISVGDEALGGASVLDTRFALSFGAIPSAAAADALADAAAGFAAATLGAAPKLVITDLDGTLWRGVAGEGEAADGATDLVLHEAYADALLRLQSRGLVLAAASRNDRAIAEAALAGFADHLGRQPFASLAVAWEGKAELVERVLAETGLAPEHTVFIDDDAVNCAAVAVRFPQMDVRLFSGDEAGFAAMLLADPRLAGGPNQAVSSSRAEQYRLKAEVDRLRAEEGGLAAFLQRLQSRVIVRPLGADDRARAAELARRVNQFAFADFRPNVTALAERHSAFDLLFRLEDAFGSHGIVGLVLARRDGDVVRLDNLLLSCRALQRGVEDAMLHALAQRARGGGVRALIGRIEPLPRNTPARDFARRLGLDTDGVFRLDLEDSLLPLPGGISIEDEKER